MLSGTGERRLIYRGQEVLAFLGSETVLAFISYRLIAAIVGTLDCSPFDLASLTGYGGAFLGSIVLSCGLGANLIQPDIAVRMVERAGKNPQI